MVRFLLDQYLNAVSPSNFALTNPDVVKRTKETNGANLVQGFANLLEDLSSGKGIVQRRTDPTAFEKGETIAATPGEVVFQNDLFQLIQYTPTTRQGRRRADALRAAAGEPLLHDRPRAAAKPGQMAGRRGPHRVRRVSWVNPTAEHKDKGVEDYVLDGVVAAIEQVRARTKAAPDLFAFCLGGTLVAIALAWLAAKGRGKEAQFGDADRQPGRFRRHARLVGVRPRRPSRRARRSSRRARAISTASSCSGCSRRCAPTT